MDWRELAKVQMEFSEVTEVVIQSTELLRRTSNEDIQRRSTKLLGAEPVILDLHKLTVDLLQILQRRGGIYEKFAIQEDGQENSRYVNSVCSSAGNTNLRQRTLVALKQVKLKYMRKKRRLKLYIIDYQSQ